MLVLEEERRKKRAELESMRRDKSESLKQQEEETARVEALVSRLTCLQFIDTDKCAIVCATTACAAA